MENDESISLKEFLGSLEGGKYTSWATAFLDQETLKALLWAIGEFGYRAESASKANWINIHIDEEVSVETGGWPEGRILVAINAIIDIVGGKKMTLSELTDQIRQTLRR